MRPKNVLLRKIALGRLGLALLLSGTLFAASAHASDWSASAVTAVPSFDSGGAVGVQTYYPPFFPVKGISDHGRGVRHKSGQSGSVYLHIPVTAPAGSSFNCIVLRAEDNTSSGFVTAAFYRQPITNSGPAEFLGSVTTGNVTDPSDGFQMISNWLPSGITLQPVSYSYYIQLQLNRTSTSATNITAYDVGLGGCIP